MLYYIIGDNMKKLFKSLLVFVAGIIIGYYICNIKIFNNLFNNTYKAFQIGVYTDYEVANIYKEKFNNAIIIKENELYRVYAAILKDTNNIENMSKYLNNNNIEYFIKEINISDKNLISEIDEYERIMNSNNEIVFLEMNKLIMEKYKESL